jgi:signal transduction histidine kinase
VSVARPHVRHSLSHRVLGLTLAAMLVTEALLFVPAISRARQDWMDQRIVAAQLAARALPSGAIGFGGGVSRATREDLLRLAGVVTVRLQEPGRPLVELSQQGQVQAAGLLDLRHEGGFQRVTRSLAALWPNPDRLLLVMGYSPKQPSTLVSVVLHEGELGRYLRAQAGEIALSGLVIAAVAGLLMYVSLLLLLVRPMRRIVASIAAFRADPERSSPLDTSQVTPLGGDEIAVAGHELALMQRELRAALWRNARLAALGTAVAKVSHDLRGVLSPALLAAERMQGHSEQTVRNAGDTVMRSVERATGLVRSTLEFVRDGPAPAAPVRVHLRTLAEEAADQARAITKTVRIQNAVPEGLIVVADAQGVARALGNLLRNGAQAGASHLRLGIATVAEQRPAIVVIDDGPGLPEALRESLFRPFASGGRAGGTGLGLAITRDLMRAQGGDVVLARTGPDGTEFHILLPPQPTAERAPTAVAGAAGVDV